MTDNQSIRTTCPYCGVGCGIIANIAEDGSVSVRGDPQHPANQGRLCSKGAALAETLSIDDRLLQPEIEGAPVSWDTALEYVAAKFHDIIQEHGPDAVAFYVSGQLLTEDYYLANKLMKGFIGSANIDTNSRLCMSSAVAGHRRAFGSDTVPCSYEDLERARLIVLTGSNTAWCHPVVYQRIVKAKKDNPDLTVVVIDPRRTATCDIADLHLPLLPGSDTTLFNGLLVYINDHEERNVIFVDNHTEGAVEALACAREQAGTLEQVARTCGLDVAAVETFYRLFARTERVVTLFSQGVNQWSFGTDKVNAIINCHLLTGRIGRPGMGPFSITGQPNAMGGREVGGLANQLAAHMHIDNEQHRQVVQKFWEAPVIATKEGLKAVDLFHAIEQGKVKAIWIMATNPAVSLPDADRVRAALMRCEFVVVSDCMRNTDSTAFANVMLPAQAWGEKDGTVTNSERCISRQRSFLKTAGDAKPDWWIIAQLAQRLGFKKYFDYTHPSCIFREHAALSGYENAGTRDFDISALAGISKDEYQHLKPIQWPVSFSAPDGSKRMFGDGRFFTPSGKARFIAIQARVPANAPNDKFPLSLNTGRVRDHWHTMTRTGKSARLSGHIYEPFAEIHPIDAKARDIEHGNLVCISSQWGRIIVRARVTDSQLRGQIFVPMHWNDQYASKSYADALVNPALDPVSGQPEFKHTPVNIAPYRAAWHGFVLSRRELDMKHIAYWSRAKGYGYWRYELAGDDAPKDWADAARLLLCSNAKPVEWIEYFDKAAQRYRAARLHGDQLESCIFIGPDYRLPERDWLASLFDKASLSPVERQSLLSGKPPSETEDAGRVICACFQVGVKTIQQAIEQKGLDSVEAIGELLKAGTNCGSCVPELRKLLQAALKKEVLAQ
ncbi:MAG: molybdopterin-dependent oxidoreductase [Gammaproteobacteria bacterium]|nr:molybdopterin-dependent oxidoreductase [Gammaproteobacteria bacterium]